MKLSVVVLRELQELVPHRSVWNDLARRSPDAQFFLTFDWFEAYWNHFGGEQDLECHLVFDEDKLVGIVPLVIRTEQRRVGKVRVLTYPLDDWGTFYGPITERPESVLKAVIQHLRANRKSWDMLAWRFGKCDLTWATLQQAMLDSKFSTHTDLRERAAIIDLPRSFDDYLAARASKFRNNVKRWRRKITEQGELRYVKHSGDGRGPMDPRWDLFDTCVQIASESWQANSTDGTTLCSPSIHEFVRSAHQAAAQVGAVDINLMYLDDAPVGFEYGYRWEAYKYSLRFGYNAEVCKLGVGNLLWLETIASSIERGDEIFDMGVGSLEYKRHYYSRVEDCLSLDHYRPLAPKAQLMLAKHRWSQWRNRDQSSVEHAGSSSS